MALFDQTLEGFAIEIIPHKRCGWVATRDARRFWFRLTGTGVKEGDAVAFELDNAGGLPIAINVRPA